MFTLPLALSGLALSLSACSEDSSTGSFPCTPQQAAPYPDGIPYLGIHADAGNSDQITCETASSFTQSWIALEGLGLTQPNTFSPDGSVTYATTSQSEADGCRLHAVLVESGEVIWCQAWEPTIAQSSVEVDSDGHLYFTVDGAVVSLDANGAARWLTEFEAAGAADAPWGVHFTPDGHVATVTSSGNVALLDRPTGQVLAELSIAETWGFVAPEPLDLEIDLLALLPDEVQADIATVWGETSGVEAALGLGSFLGAGQFVDNTLAISPTGHLYVVGGGPDAEHGALVQVRVEGTPSAPVLTPGWFAELEAGSGSSPSVNRTGSHVVVTDGTSTESLLDPDSVVARVRVADIEACDANTDGDTAPDRCDFAFEEIVERSPLPGAPAILDDGTVVFYEFGLDFSAEPGDRDLVAVGVDGTVWETALEGDLDWNSVVTVTENHVIGTASKVVLSDQDLLGLTFPAQTEDWLLVLDRETGLEVFRASIPDDSSATVTIGADGALYVGVLGLLSILSVDDRPDLGLVRFDPSNP